jgi:hypothetical protein
LLTSIPAVASGLLVEADASEPDGTFYFLFDRYGVAYLYWDETLADVRDGVRLFDELRDALGTNAMNIGLLVSAGVLPRTLDAVALEEITARLRPVRDVAQNILQAADGGRFADGAPSDRPGLWLVFTPNAEIVAPPDPATLPMVFVPAQEEAAYKDLEDWLTDAGALAAKSRKED